PLIDPSSVRPPQIQRPTVNVNRAPPEVKPPDDQDTSQTLVDRAPSYEDLIRIADDMSAVLSQFRRRSEIDKRSPNSADPFERILEGEAEPKVEKLLHIVHASE